MSDTYPGSDNLEVMLEAVNYNTYLKDLVRQFAADANPVLDFGAGIGTFTNALDLPPSSIHCIEPDTTAQNQLAETGYRVYADLEEISGQQFEYIFTLNVLEHIADDQLAVGRLYDLLIPGGTLFAYVPALDHLRTSMDDLVGHHRRYSRASLIRLMEDNNFTVEHACYTDFLGYFATLLFRLMDTFKSEPTGKINKPLLIAYDRLIFPISRVLSRPFAKIMGKNAYVVARKPA